MNGDLRKVFKELLSEGWAVDRGKKHYKLKSPYGFTITVSLTPSCPFAHKNFLGDLKRARLHDQEKMKEKVA